jgi:hypothetical protein
VAVVAGVLVVPVVGVAGVVAVTADVGVVAEFVVVPPPQAAKSTSALKASREKKMDLRYVFMVVIPYI